MKNRFQGDGVCSGNKLDRPLASTREGARTEWDLPEFKGFKVPNARDSVA